MEYYYRFQKEIIVISFEILELTEDYFLIIILFKEVDHCN